MYQREKPLQHQAIPKKSNKSNVNIYDLVQAAKARGWDVESIMKDLAERDPDPEGAADDSCGYNS
jgi:hypothetical protein